MIAQSLRQVLEATGYLENGEPVHGVYLEDDARTRCKAREFEPDALWRSDSALNVYFKLEQEDPSTEQVERWRQEIWNQGFAPLLWVVSPHRIDLYNGFGRPRETEDAAAYLLDTFELIASELDRLDAFAGRLAMETGQFWQQAGAVDRKTSVDQQLLSDLAALEQDLVDSGLDYSSAQGLIGRSIFTQYLIDRKIVTEQILERDYGHGTLPEILRVPAATEQLFDWLREIFNGDMFPLEQSMAPRLRHLCRIADFLEAVDPESGQTTLFPYQFDVIPVELISSIYEQFAHSDPSTPNSNGNTGLDIFYTRLPLVSLVLDEVMEGLTGKETVIDLTCGSGVFLVESLRRLVDIQSNGGDRNRELIRSILHQQIYGVDVNESAVRVAAFSLYLAALELDPDPQPPHALKFEPLIGKTLIVADAYHVETTASGRLAMTERGVPKKFDVIVGNPPWSYRGEAGTAGRRLRSSPRNALAPRGESLDFVYRAMDFASEKTRFGLILSAVQFFSQSTTGMAASSQLIEILSPVTLVNLSNQSGWLFKKGDMPAVVLFARHRKLSRDTITTVQVPWSPAEKKVHTFEIAPSNIHTLSLADWKRRPKFLKATFVGARRDLSLLDRLTSDHSTLSDHFRGVGAKLRAGLTLGDRSRDSSFLRGLPLLNATNIRPFSVPDDLESFDAANAQWPRNRNIYRAPLLLFKEFVRSDGRPVVAVTDRDTVFNNSIFGAALPSVWSDAAHLLAAILSSALASWYYLMTASAFGLWMRRLLLQDVEHMPVPDIEKALYSKVGIRLTELAREFQDGTPSPSEWDSLDEAVFDLYDLDESDRIVARDGLFRASWQWQAGRNASVKAAEVRDVSIYARTFQMAVEAWLSAANQRCMRAEVFELPERAPLRVVRFILDERTRITKPSRLEVVTPDGDLRDVLNRIGERLEVPLANSLIGQRELRVHGHNEVVIIKPAALRHWMGVSALEDADSVIVESFSGIAE